MKVTNIQGYDKNENPQQGFYMDGYLVQNLLGIPRFLKQGYDCVGIISGNGKVRIGKSTAAMQNGTFIAWLLAGGNIKMHQQHLDGRDKWVIDKINNPTKEVKFNLYENVVFSADQLIDTAFKLHKKYGKNQVIVYDEGRQGLDSARAMESINKGMEDFFQECGFMGHVILIVLPNFFKLHEDYAISRSLFLVNVYANRKFQRGFFDFYNEYQKEKLFFFGKKRIGIRAKYSATDCNFSGRFTGWFPFDKNEYENLKKQALAKKRRTRIQQKFKKQRDSVIYLLKRAAEWSNQKIAEELSAISGQKISPRTIDYAIQSISGRKATEDD